MKKKVPLTMAIGCVILAIITTVNLTYLYAQSNFNAGLSDFSALEQEYEKFTEIRAYIEKYYVGNYSSEQAMEMALSGYILGMGDSWSHYLNKEQFTKYKNESSGNLTGIGVTVKYSSASDAIEVSDVYSNSPAGKAGIKPFDLITAVDSKKVSDIGYSAAVDMVRGEIGTKVKITILDPKTNISKDLTIKRDKFQPIVITSQMLNNNIGYIKISEFLSGSEKDFSAKLNKLIKDGATSLIFDVRFNPGGSVATVSDMLDKLVPEGDIISLKDKNGKGSTLTSDKAEINLPMVVLTNEYSISAAEFFAATLKEYDKATIVGEKTTGKGYSQETIELKDGSGLILSTNTYYTSKGNNLAEKGITPDVPVSLTNEQKQNFSSLAGKDDTQLQKAIEILSK